MPRHVLVTRPAGQAQLLVDALSAHGYRVSHVPALEIEPVPMGAAVRQALAGAHAVFFVSANAARLALNALSGEGWCWPSGVHCLAVGEATAEVLREAGVPVTVPETGYNSEAVLALPCLQDLAGKHVLVLRGDGGRELFAGALRDRGATVDYIAVYRRHCAAAFHCPPGTDTVLVTSVQSWSCMAASIDPAMCVVAGSERIAEAIRNDHAGPVVVAPSPHDQDMLATLERL